MIADVCLIAFSSRGTVTADAPLRPTTTLGQEPVESPGQASTKI